MQKPVECKRRNELAEITNLCPEWFQGKEKHDSDEIRFNCAAGVNNFMNPILTAGCNSVSLTLPTMLQTHGSPIADPSLFQSPIAYSRSPRPTSHRFRSIDSTPPHQLLEESLNINYPGLVRELPGSHWSLIIFEPLTPSPPPKKKTRRLEEGRVIPMIGDRVIDLVYIFRLSFDTTWSQKWKVHPTSGPTHRKLEATIGNRRDSGIHRCVVKKNLSESLKITNPTRTEITRHLCMEEIRPTSWYWKFPSDHRILYPGCAGVPWRAAEIPAAGSIHRSFKSYSPAAILDFVEAKKHGPFSWKKK